MNPCGYVPLTADEVALVLDFSDCDEMTGRYIAQKALDGMIEFTCEELALLAMHKNVTVDFLTEHDPPFRRYANTDTTLRTSIAMNVIKLGVDIEIAAEICGLPLNMLREAAGGRGVKPLK